MLSIYSGDKVNFKNVFKVKKVIQKQSAFLILPGIWVKDAELDKKNVAMVYNPHTKQITLTPTDLPLTVKKRKEKDELVEVEI
jgi:hypothetical protein